MFPGIIIMVIMLLEENILLPNRGYEEVTQQRVVVVAFLTREMNYHAV